EDDEIRLVPAHGLTRSSVARGHSLFPISGAAIRPTRSPRAALPDPGFMTTVAPVATMSFNSRSRTETPGATSGTRAQELSTGPTAIRRAVSRQRHQGEDRTR